MCNYDDMNVLPMHHVTHHVLRTMSSKPHSCSFISRRPTSTYLKNTFKNILENTRLWLLLYLLISPVSAGPLIRPFKNTRSTSDAVPLRRSQKEHPRVGIGIVQTAKRPGLPFESHESLLNIPKVSKKQYNNIINSPTVSLGDIYSFNKNIRDRQSKSSGENYILSSLATTYNPSDLRISKQVPNQSGVSYWKPTSFSRVVPTLRIFTSHSSRGSSTGASFRKSPVLLRLSSMDEGDEIQAGRERRATPPSSSSGGGHWMKPCPNLDSKLDETATPASLSAQILRAIHEAKSQVDNFINDFAREAFQVDSWQDSLAEHSDFSLAFLNNSSGTDLGDPALLSFPEALQEAYELMQRRAVGIEQVTLDQALYQASFLTEFRHVEDRIVHVLCELRYAMIQSGVTPKEDVTKDVMEEETRDMDSERRRNIRDAVILREYVTGLQVLHQLFNHFTSGGQ